MLKNVTLLWLSVGRKTIVGIAGLALSLFLVIHLLGNLTLFSSDPNDFNKYAHQLESFGPILSAAEIILLIVFVSHFVVATLITLRNGKARPERYHKKARAGKTSQMTLSSRTMIYTGLVLLAFVVWHLFHFKFGPGINEGYVVQVDGLEIRDFHRLVVEEFHKPVVLVLYLAVMTFLGFHLRHGFWSAFQTLGLNHPKYMPLIQAFGIFFAIIMALGFLLLPIWIYITASL